MPKRKSRYHLSSNKWRANVIISSIYSNKVRIFDSDKLKKIIHLHVFKVDKQSLSRGYELKKVGKRRRRQKGKKNNKHRFVLIHTNQFVHTVTNAHIHRTVFKHTLPKSHGAVRNSINRLVIYFLFLPPPSTSSSSSCSSSYSS